MEAIKICTAYEYNGKKYTNIPGIPGFLDKCECIYEEHPGWMSDTSKVTSYEDLPENAKKYLDRIKELVGTNIIYVSVGKDRKQTLSCG